MNWIGCLHILIGIQPLENEIKDLNAMLPYLSAYMGHAQLSDTYYYIHLVPGLMEEMSDFAFSSAEVLLPEVETDE